jgi:nicotinate-nucleotide adenylyltransferase
VTAIGIFGGSFDPVHRGHIRLARAAIDQFSLARLYVIPVFQPPHKMKIEASFDHRLAMARRAFSAWPEVDVSDLERERGGISFTIDTVDILRRRHPDDELFLVVGSDTSEDLPLWRDPDKLARTVRLLIAPRRGTPPAAGPHWRFDEIKMDPVNVSATEIRQAVRAGRSIDEYVPKAVAQYILHHQLYH